MRNASKIFILIILSFLVGCSYTLTNKNIYGVKLFLQQTDDKSSDAIYIMINNNGIIRGFNGCNTFNAKVYINDTKQTIKFTSIASTNKICNFDKNKAEQTFMRALLAATVYEIADNKMILKNNNKENLATFYIK